MARNSRKDLQRVGSGTETILPDETDEEFLIFREKFLAELAPNTEYARSIATDIVFAVWDIQRHRRLLAANIRSEYKRQAERILAGGPGYLQTGSAELIDNLSYFVSDLMAKQPDAIAELAKRGTTPSELTAVVFEGRAATVKYHETRIADLERRRSRLMAEYERLQAASKSRYIEDAVELG